MNQEQFEICTMLGSILREEEPDTEVGDSCRTAICAEDNEVFELIYPYICDCLPSKIKPVFDMKLMQLSLACENIMYEWKRISEYAENKKIYLLMLKGIENRNFYPEPRSRQMTDIDLYFKHGQKNEISEMMTALGYKQHEISAKHIHWHNPSNNVSVEMHNSLFSEEGIGKDFYSELVENAEKADGCEYIFKMNDTDNYIYTLAHFHRHFSHSTANLKQLADLFVLENYANPDFEKIEKETKDLGINEFYKKTNDLIKTVFCEKNKPENELEKFADIILRNTSFVEQKNRKENRLMRVLHLLFPKPEKIYVFYPFIYKHKIFLPFGYVLRIIKCLKSDRKIIKEKIQ